MNDQKYIIKYLDNQIISLMEFSSLLHSINNNEHLNQFYFNNLVREGIATYLDRLGELKYPNIIRERTEA